MVTFNPTIPTMTKNKKNILIIDVDSFKKIMPTTTVPTAPIAVQQAYAVPRGIPFIDCSNNTILIIRNITVKAEGINFVNPSEYFKKSTYNIHITINYG